jgi:hypothetical protein
MNRSFNSNIKFKGKVYHIQTEVYKETVVTNVFDKGRVIYTQKKDFVDFRTTLAQHQSIETKIKQGDF